MSLTRPEENDVNYPNVSKFKKIRRRGRDINVPRGHVDTVIDDNQKCPICFQFSMFPVFSFRTNEKDYGLPLSGTVIPSASLVTDSSEQLFNPQYYLIGVGHQGSQRDNTASAHTAMECLNTRCPNRSTGMRFRQAKVLEDTEI